jgi:hypothetical protein
VNGDMRARARCLKDRDWSIEHNLKLKLLLSCLETVAGSDGGGKFYRFG